MTLGALVFTEKAIHQINYQLLRNEETSPKPLMSLELQLTPGPLNRWHCIVYLR